MNNLQLFLKWGEHSLIPHLYEQDWYNGGKVINRTGFTSSRASKRLGRLRLRQARIKKGESLLSLETQGRQILKVNKTREESDNVVPITLLATFARFNVKTPRICKSVFLGFQVFRFILLTCLFKICHKKIRKSYELITNMFDRQKSYTLVLVLHSLS